MLNLAITKILSEKDCQVKLLRLSFIEPAEVSDSMWIVKIYGMDPHEQLPRGEPQV